VFWLARPWLKRAVQGDLKRHCGLSSRGIGLILMVLFTSGAITSTLGIFAIIGGFVIGVALHEDRRFVHEWKTRVGPIVQTLFLPIFFVYTGLRTDIGTLPGISGALDLLLVCAIAFATKFSGAYLAARLAGEDSRGAWTIGVCMNTRALMELIVLNIGLDLGILPTSMFTMLVIMAILSTFMATPLIRWLMRGQERSSGLVEGVLLHSLDGRARAAAAPTGGEVRWTERSAG
jgi:Kef-type K+ transport system membrane component KefB